MKKLLSLVLTAVLLAGLLPVSALAEEVYWQDDAGIKYYYEGSDELTITRIWMPSEMLNGAYDLVIPGTIETQDGPRNVTKLTCSLTGVRSVTVPATVTEIGDATTAWGVFSDSNIKSVYFAEGSRLKRIGTRAFYNSGITAIDLPDTVESIGDCAFQYVPLTEIDLPESLRTIGDYAFEGTHLTSLALPDSVESVGDHAFDASSTGRYCEYIAALTLGSGLKHIGEFAFRETAVASLDLPDSLETLGVGAFQGCELLTSVTWPQNDLFTTVTGFEGCTSLADSAILTALPGSVTGIGDRAFTGCGFTALELGPNVGYVGWRAFSGNPIASLRIAAGSTPLRIGCCAFYGTSLGGTSVTLPARVDVLNEGAFGGIRNDAINVPGQGTTYNGPEFHIQNNAIQFLNDETFNEGFETVLSVVHPFYDCYSAKIYYPADMNSESFTACKDYCESLDEAGYLPPHFYMEADEPEPETPVHAITGTVPAGAAVRIAVGTEAVTPVLDGQSFRVEAPEGSYVTVVVTLDGFADYTVSKTGAAFTADWDLGEIALVPLALTGALSVETTGAGAAGANIVLFDAADRVVYSGTAAGGACVVSELPAGDYTVLAFAQNPFLSAVSAVGDLAALGLGAGSYATAAVTVSRGATANLTLSVPAMDTAALSALVVQPGTDVLIDRAHITPNLSFLVRVSYTMADGHPADSLRVVIPAGFTVESVASYERQYTVGSVWDAGAGVVTVSDLTGDAAKSGTLFVGLRTANTGKFAVSASVQTGGAAVPVGSASFQVSAVTLELPSGRVSSRTFRADVYAAPNTAVTLQVGGGATQTVTTNANGVWSGAVSLPAGSVYGSSAKVLAQAGGSAATGSVHYADTGNTVEELYFVHAGRQTYAVRNGSDVSGGYYTYVANGTEEAKYWSFSVTIRTAAPITEAVILHVRFLDGGWREQQMSLASSGSDANGWTQVYVCTVYIDAPGNHVFDSSLIPNGFYVTYTSLGREFTLNDDVVNYVEGVAQADQAGYEQTVTDWGDPGDGWDLGEDGFFGDYTIHDEPWFNEIPAPDQGVIYDAEQAAGDLFDILGDFLGLDEPLNEYTNGDDLLGDSRIDTTPPDGWNYDPDTLRNDDYTVADDGSFAYRERYGDDGEPEGIDYADEAGSYLSLDFQDNAADNLNQAIISQTVGLGSEALNQLNDLRLTLQTQLLNMAPGAEKAAMEAELRSIKSLGGKLNILGNIAGGITGIWQAATNSSDYIDHTVAVEELKGDLEILKNTIKDNYIRHGAGSDCINALDNEILAGERLLTLLMRQKAWTLSDTVVGATFTATGAVLSLFTAGAASAACAGGNLAYDVVSNSAGLARADEIAKLQAEFAAATASRMQHCGDAVQGGAVYGFTPCLDPSGVVFEAIESNLLEGVTATACNEGGVWNAVPYDQVNPQVTGPDGSYAWDVPPGTWHVTFTKDGYAPAQTADMPVPPPQTGLKTAMVATAAPAVESAQAYPEYAELVFTQYMDTAAALTVPAGYTAVWVDPEPAGDGSGKTYARVLRLTPDDPAQTGDAAAVTLSGAVSYNGQALPDYAQDLVVAARPAEIRLNYETTVSVQAGTAKNLTVRVFDGAGDPMRGVTLNALSGNIYLATIAASAVTDDAGAAVFALDPLLPGLTTLHFSVAGTTLTREIALQITVDANRPERPTIGIAGNTFGAGAPKENTVTVPAGSMLTLSCATPGAVIYYTLNDTCPCQDAGARTVYTAPIPVTEDAYFRVVAYKDGMAYSERINLRVTVSEGGGGGTTPAPSEEPFIDVPADAFYHDAVLWAVENGITEGVGDNRFDPAGVCTRAQVVTFLWRAAGKPAPTGTDNPFRDVAPDAYYYEAVLWAAENGITKGVSDDSFDPDGEVTREQCVSFLYRMLGTSAAGESPFEDVPADRYSYDAVNWAAETGVTSGTGPTTFSPEDDCLRCQVVTFLYRCFA